MSCFQSELNRRLKLLKILFLSRFVNCVSVFKTLVFSLSVSERSLFSL